MDDALQDAASLSRLREDDAIDELNFRKEKRRLELKEIEARMEAALEEKRGLTEARRIANLHDWLELAGSDDIVRFTPADRIFVNDMLRTMTLT
jgi:hypothetical protein